MQLGPSSFATGGAYQHVIIWNVRSGKLETVCELDGHFSDVFSLTLLPGDRYIFLQ
jgi:hypothetical protein